MPEPSQEAQRIVDFIRKSAGSRKAIVGLSGGIDSSVVYSLCIRALGPERVIGLFLPDARTPASDEEDVMELANSQKGTYRKVSIEPMVSAFVDTLGATDRRAIGNIKSRVRMVVLYYYANTDGGIVVGTTNRTEYLTGYYTKYGDGACDIEPIMHLYKHQVREMASYLGVPRRIIEKKPTAGLWEGQTDEDELGITYDRLDRILEDLFDLRIGTLTEEHRRIRAMYEETKHKREMPRSLQ